MISHRKLEALRNLAERPGTEAEGLLAREVLLRLGAPPVLLTAEQFAVEAADRFPAGKRAYYNRWAYDKNCSCRVIRASQTPFWIRVKFDHLKSGYRDIPIYSELGWHLSSEPLPDKLIVDTGLRGGMERIETYSAAAEW